MPCGQDRPIRIRWMWSTSTALGMGSAWAFDYGVAASSARSPEIDWIRPNSLPTGPLCRKSLRPRRLEARLHCETG